VFGLDEELLAWVPQPCVAVIANVERLKKAEDKKLGDADLQGSHFYMKQTNVLDNACGVIACLHAIYNNQDKIGTITENSILANHLAATKSLSPSERATALETNSSFQQAHRSVAGEGESKIPENQSEVRHHFIAFVVDSQGRLLELDGTKVGPVVIAESCEDVLRGAAAEIRSRLASGAISESLNLMTLIGSQN